ncbi:hypothetical protein CDAR_416581 [Caerostris darwini]|uniref:Uncharacterized protein n=1 Tax=Caerostris darwini TaxID=1538125 RepID=A0AAV4MJT2_9ARAC|nr:hypothetical protein CDAR_416581 [Caerostris darwini]
MSDDDEYSSEEKREKQSGRCLFDDRDGDTEDEDHRRKEDGELARTRLQRLEESDTRKNAFSDPKGKGDGAKGGPNRGRGDARGLLWGAGTGSRGSDRIWGDSESTILRVLEEVWGMFMAKTSSSSRYLFQKFYVCRGCDLSGSLTSGAYMIRLKCQQTIVTALGDEPSTLPPTPPPLPNKQQAKGKHRRKTDLLKGVGGGATTPPSDDDSNTGVGL